MDFEKKLEELESIVEKLGSGELSLEESLKLFEKGVKLSRQCSEQLSQSEKKVQELIDINSKGLAETKDFVE